MTYSHILFVCTSATKN